MTSSSSIDDAQELFIRVCFDDCNGSQEDGDVYAVFVRPDATLTGVREVISNQLGDDERVIPSSYFFQYYNKNAQRHVDVTSKQEGQPFLRLANQKSPPALWLTIRSYAKKRARKEAQELPMGIPGNAMAERSSTIAESREELPVPTEASTPKKEIHERTLQSVATLEDTTQEPTPSRDNEIGRHVQESDPLGEPVTSSDQNESSMDAESANEEVIVLWSSDSESETEPEPAQIKGDGKPSAIKRKPDPTLATPRPQAVHSRSEEPTVKSDQNPITASTQPRVARLRQATGRTTKPRAHFKPEPSTDARKCGPARAKSQKRAGKSTPEKRQSSADGTKEGAANASQSKRRKVGKKKPMNPKDVCDLTGDDSDDDAMEQSAAPMKRESEEADSREEQLPPLAAKSSSVESHSTPDNPTSTNDTRDGSQSNASRNNRTGIAQDSSVAARASNDDLGGDGGTTDPEEAPLAPEVKEEMTRKDMKNKRENVYGKYRKRFLLDRQSMQGIARLGGSVQGTYPKPRDGHSNIWDKENRQLIEGYPFPKFLTNLSSDTKPHNMKPFQYAAYNATWNINAPKYAGQPFAAVTKVPEYFQTTGYAFPIFIKRKRGTTKSSPLLGWEYVGNYKLAAQEGCFWESSRNYGKDSKELIASKILQSSKSEDGYGRQILDGWRLTLIEAMKNDDSDAAPAYMIENREPTADEKDEKVPSLAARARALAFYPDTPDEELAYMLVKIDEFHKQQAIIFVEYDERIYDYCSGKGGLTNHDGSGNMCKNTHKPPATAGDWYAYAEEKMLMT